MNTRRCPVCRGIAVLGEDGLYCYSCGRAIHDPQKRLAAWCATEPDKEDDEGQQIQSLERVDCVGETRRWSG